MSCFGSTLMVWYVFAHIAYVKQKRNRLFRSNRCWRCWTRRRLLVYWNSLKWWAVIDDMHYNTAAVPKIRWWSRHNSHSIKCHADDEQSLKKNEELIQLLSESRHFNGSCVRSWCCQIWLLKALASLFRKWTIIEN